jgi:Glycosyl hydrolase family 26
LTKATSRMMISSPRVVVCAAIRHPGQRQPMSRGRTKFGALAILATVGVVWSATARSTAAAPATCGKLLAPTAGAYLGAFPDFNSPDGSRLEDYVDPALITNFEQLAGRKISWAYFSQYWFRSLAFPGDQLLAIWRHGEVPFVRLLPYSDAPYGPPPNETFPETKFSLQHIIDGQFDSELRAWADAARDTNIPILAEFGTEVDGVWVPWNGWWNGQVQLDGYGDPTFPDGPERFRDAYRHIVDLFRSEGATNVTWFFHAQTQRFFPQDEWWNNPTYYYPGDDYIDWIGLSNYGPINPDDPHFITFDDKLSSSGVYDTLTAISRRPIAITEFAIIDNARWDKAQWIKDAFRAVKARYPRIRGLAWWDAGLPGPQDMRINSSPQALDAFRAAANDPYFAAPPQFSGTCAPSTPSNLTARSTRSGVLLRWTGSANSVRYEVWRGGTRMTTSTSTYLDTTARRHTTYHYAIRALNPLGWSPVSTPVAAHRG